MPTITDPVPRIERPEPAQGSAPSFSPPDTRYAPGLTTARLLGWFGIGLGLAEVLLPDLMGGLTGVRRNALLRAHGVREIVCGVGILNCDRPAGWLWARVAGDVIDLASLAAADDYGRATLAGVAVLGVTALDTACALGLSAAAALEGVQ